MQALLEAGPASDSSPVISLALVERRWCVARFTCAPTVFCGFGESSRRLLQAADILDLEIVLLRVVVFRCHIFLQRFAAAVGGRDQPPPWSGTAVAG